MYLFNVSEQAITTLTLEGFLAWETARAERYELVGGRAYAMAGGTERHDLMAGRFFALLGPAAEPGGCRTFIANRKLRVSTGDVYYPDVFVVCGPAGDVQFEADANLIVEILSPSTRAQDRREKVRSYATLPSLTHYVVAEPDIRRIEVARWDTQRQLTWGVLGPGDQLHTPYGTWNIDDIYDWIDSVATT